MTTAAIHLRQALEIISARTRAGIVGRGVDIQLQKAKMALLQAAHNKGGHRKLAIDLINQAIRSNNPQEIYQYTRQALDEVDKGIDHAGRKFK